MVTLLSIRRGPESLRGQKTEPPPSAGGRITGGSMEEADLEPDLRERAFLPVAGAESYIIYYGLLAVSHQRSLGLCFLTSNMERTPPTLRTHKGGRDNHTR